MSKPIITVNGTPVVATEFAYDGCHKIYVIVSASDRKTFEEYGYSFYRVEDLERAYNDSCGLRFISYSNLSLPDLAQQGEEAVFGLREETSL